MKYLILFITLTFSYFLVLGQSPADNKWKENIVKNRIQSQEQWNYKYEKGKPRKDGYKNFTKKFDLNGNVIEEIYYKSDNIDKKHSYKYDKNDNTVEYVNYKGDENTVMFMQSNTYDNSGLKIREERFNGENYQIIKYNYNDQKKVAEIIRSDLYGNIAHKRTFNYLGNNCTIAVYDEGKEIGKIINRYDKNDNIIETLEYDLSGKLKEKYVYEYNNKLLLQKTKFIGDKFLYKETYSYNKNANLTEVSKEEPKGNIFLNNIYRYDTKGNLVEEEWYDNNPNENSKKTYFYNDKEILESVEVYYALYKYKIQYKYNYTFY